MKLQSLNIKRLRKSTIAAVRSMLKQYNINYSIADDKEKLISKLEEVRYYADKIKIHQRYDYSL